MEIGRGAPVLRPRGRRGARAVRRDAGLGRRPPVGDRGGLVRGHVRVLLEAARRLQPVRGRGGGLRRAGVPRGRRRRVAGRVRAGRRPGAAGAPAHRPGAPGPDAQPVRVPVPGVRRAARGTPAGHGRVRRSRGRDRHDRPGRAQRGDAGHAAHPGQPDDMDRGGRKRWRRVARGRRRGGGVGGRAVGQRYRRAVRLRDGHDVRRRDGHDAERVTMTTWV